MSKKLHSILLAFIISFGVFFEEAFANRSEVDSITQVGKNQSSINAICSLANKVAGSEILVYTGSDGLLSFSNNLYSLLPVDVKREFMETALLGTKNSGLGTQVKNKVYNFIAEQDSTSVSAVKYLRADASADFAVASTWFKPFGSFFGIILGMLSLFIFMFIGVSILVDIAYMVLPGLRVVLENGQDGKPKWVSLEAYSSVKECEDLMKNNNYKGYMSIYFKRRTPSVIAMAISLGYLISGQIYDFIVYIIDSFSWIFQV